MHRPVLTAFLASVILVVTLMVGGTLFLVFGPKVEQQFFPVISRPVITQVQNQVLTVLLTGYRTRSCSLVDVDAAVLIDNEWRHATITPVSELKAQTTRSGYHFFGMYRITPHGSALTIETRHNCHALWQTPSYIGTLSTK